MAKKPKPEPHVLSERFAEPDLVDAIFDYVVALHPEISSRRFEMTAAVREKFAGERAYVKRTNVTEELAVELLRNFNGRNASEIGRKLGIGRTTVYMLLKQPGSVK